MNFNLIIITLSYSCNVLLFSIIMIRFLYYMYKKMFNSISAADIYFSKNTWNNYMFGVVKYKDIDNQDLFDSYIDKFINRVKSWELNAIWYKKYNIRGIIEINETDTKDIIIYKLNNSQPEYVNDKLLPFKIIILKKEKIILSLLNHYYCDGIVLHDYLIFNLCNIKHSEFPPRYTDIVTILLSLLSIGFHS